MVNLGMAGVGSARAGAPGTYAGSRFSDIRAQLLSDGYATLPRRRTTISAMFKGWTNVLKLDSLRRLASEEDLEPPRPKLLHRAGICLFGRWIITEDTGYTGCFRPGTDHLIIVRCSTLLSQTHRGSRRGFGIAGKIFPTLDPDELVKTANFITIDTLGGTLADRFTDVALTNEPPLGVNLGLLRDALVVANVVVVFNAVDSTPSFRPLTRLTACGLRPGETPKGPKWMQLTTEAGIGTSDAADFRDELRVANYKDGRLRFTISVATETSPEGTRLWRRIGVIELTEDVCSKSGDERLRFQHVPNRRQA
ncbi:MAG: hypothetical protein ACRD26_03305 [Vicinamibacterales bacterium]